VNHNLDPATINNVSRVTHRRRTGDAFPTSSNHEWCRRRYTNIPFAVCRLGPPGASLSPPLRVTLVPLLTAYFQAATQAIYGDERPPVPSRRPIHHEEEETRPLMEQMEIDDSLVFDRQPVHRAPRPPAAAYAFPGRAGNNGPGGLGIGIFSIIMAPFSLTLNILSSLLHFVFRILRIPFPRLRLNMSSSSSFNRSGRRGSYSDDPATVAERWVRELEEETGALCVSKAALIDAQANGNGSQDENEAGPSSGGSRLVKRHPTRTKTLPDFFLGGYDAALKAAQRDARVLCVVLTSEEHDDVPAFRRDVLTDPELVRVLTDNHIIVWGGDVRERDGYQGASLLLS